MRFNPFTSTFSHSQSRVSQKSSPDDKLEAQASKPSGLIPIRVEFETETHRIRDCFVWNSNEVLITPEKFASVFCADLDLPQRPWVETVANQMRAQIEEHEAVATMDLSPIVEYSMASALSAPNADMGGMMIPDCRVILSVSVRPSFSSSCWLSSPNLHRSMYRSPPTI